MSPACRREAGFSLVEVTIALAVAAFCLIAVFGLIPTGLNTSKAAINLTTATSIMAAVDTDLRAAPLSAGARSPTFGFDLANTGEQTLVFAADGTPTGAIGGAAGNDSLYEAAVTLIPPAADEKSATKARIRVTWPALVQPVAARPGSVEVVTALDRN